MIIVSPDPSTTGGITVGGVVQSVLLKKDGSAIAPVFKPSKRDVQGLRKMYGVRASGFLGKLLGDINNPLKNLFDKIRKKDRDSGCSS